MYFNKFPAIIYDSVGAGEYKVVTHLLKRVAIHSKSSSVAALFDTYDVRNGETPEMISHKYYGDAEYHWIILMLNNITDRYHQWPMNTRQFLSHLAERYDNMDATHHYEINQTSGNTDVKINIGISNIDVNGDTISDATLITNREYEELKQDEIRKIRLLDPEYLEKFVDDFTKLISNTKD
jgi:hypothetical protein|tara:strand:- start:248 stop:790 length:543 start_codon:yes stop_codon:yes gene_type:complete